MKRDGSFEYVRTSPCGRGQRHLNGYVGTLFRIRDPDSVRVGHCFLAGRLKEGDLFLCTRHSGDCFQDYIYVEEYSNSLRGQPQWSFGSYGIGDAEVSEYELKPWHVELLKAGKSIEFEEVDE